MDSLIGVKRILIEANHEGRDWQNVGGIPDQYSSCSLKSIKLALERHRESPIGRNDRDAGLQAGGKVYKNFVRKDFRKIQKGPHAAVGYRRPVSVPAVPACLLLSPIHQPRAGRPFSR